MDFVLPYIDNNDEIWQKQYINTCNQMNLPIEVDSNRYKNWDNLIYIFRGIDKFMPYIDKVYLIVSNKEQIPNWLNIDKVNVVLHEDIIPKEFLPTFNSCTIEMFLKNIPNLSNQFIYSNDDIFILKEIKEEELFEGNNPCLSFKEATVANSIYKRVLYNEYKEIGRLFRNFDDNWITFRHGLNSFNLEDIEECYSRLEKKILVSCTKFRTEKNFNQNLFSYYNYFKKNYSESKLEHKYYDFSNGVIKNLEDIKDTIIHQKCQTICINDNINFKDLDTTFNICKETINNALNSILPNKSKYEKDYTSLKLKVETSNIDFVFPYVNSDDENWQKLYKENVGNESSWAAGIERFRDSGTLKYLFRGIEKNLPWINKVHMLVASKSQVPSWINTNVVDIITHDQFIPKEYLPTFNSTAIEMFLPNLNVSEKFIYSNDDLFPFKKLNEDYFFKGNLPSYQITLRRFLDTAPGDIIRRNCYNLITREKVNNRVVTTQHGTISYRLSWIKECYKKYKEQILNSCTKFRDNKNFNQYLYAFYQMFCKVINNTEKNIACYITNQKQIEKILNSSFETFDFVCINDDNSTTKEEWKKIINKLDKYFPVKSKYEL